MHSCGYGVSTTGGIQLMGDGSTSSSAKGGDRVTWKVFTSKDCDSELDTEYTADVGDCLTVSLADGGHASLRMFCTSDGQALTTMFSDSKCGGEGDFSHAYYGPASHCLIQSGFKPWKWV
jgi:hypothetical protein